MYHKPTINLKLGTYHRLAKVQGKTFDEKVDYLLSLVENRKGKFCWYLDVEQMNKNREV
jgi:hypothetical protein